MRDVSPGSYLKLERVWNEEDRIQLELDMSIRHIEGGRRLKGHVSIYRGPCLFAFDPRFNPGIRESYPLHGYIPSHRVPLPLPDVEKLSQADLLPQEAGEYGSGLFRPWMLMEIPTAGDMKIILCDFATAGYPGTSYRSWLRAIPG